MSERENRSDKIRPELTRTESFLEIGCVATLVVAWFGLINEMAIILDDFANKGVAQVSTESIAKALTFATVAVAQYIALEEMKN